MHENNSQLFWGMFIEPYSHFLMSPRPFKRMCIKLIVLRPSSIEMIDQCLAASPGLTLEVAQGESMIEQFSLVEPGSMNRGKTRSVMRRITLSIRPTARSAQKGAEHGVRCACCHRWNRRDRGDRLRASVPSRTRVNRGWP